MNDKRKVPEINGASLADISFLLLIFFLSVTSMATDNGLIRRLPPPVDEHTIIEDIKVKERNVMVVLLNSNNQLMVQREYTHVGELRAKAREFITNPMNKENLPELRDTVLPFLGHVRFTKNHVISLQNDRGTEYQAYIEVQNELIAAYNELRNEMARAHFNVSFDELDQERQDEIKLVFDQKISEAEPKNYGGAR